MARYTPKDDEALRYGYATYGPGEMARRLSRSYGSVHMRAKRLGLNFVPNWSAEEKRALAVIERTISGLLPNRSIAAVAQRLTRSYG
jgi:hypothetical protein